MSPYKIIKEVKAVESQNVEILIKEVITVCTILSNEASLILTIRHQTKI